MRRTSIFGDCRVHFVRPCKDTTLQVQDLAKAGALQKIYCFGGALAAAAVCHDFTRAIEFTGALREIAERNQVAAKIADLIFVRLADVKDEEIVAAIQSRFQFARRDFGNRKLRRGSFFAANATEFRVVD